MSAPKVRVKRGQVWRDGDKRMRGRTVMIEAVDRSAGYAAVESNKAVRSRVRLDRFDGRQYMLVG